MEQTPKNNFLNKVEKDIQDKIAYAKKNAFTQEEYKIYSEKYDEKQSVENTRELTDKEVDNFYPFYERNEKATVKVETLPEAKIVMQVLGFDEKSLLDTLSHENAHGNKASQLGAEHNGYSFVLIKNEEGGFDVLPQANTYIPDEWEKEKQNKIRNEITQAPEDYGNEMSDNDRRSLIT